MKIVKNTIPIRDNLYQIENIAPLSDILFVDIETTGFTAKNSYLYLIGCLYYEYDNWYLKQWLADNYQEEETILREFVNFCYKYKVLIHYNGNNFDIPYLTQKCIQYGIEVPFDALEGIDLYRRIAPYKNFLGLENCKQKTIENFLGIQREDEYRGGELISVYHDYVTSPSQFSRDLLFLHNSDDIQGMFASLSILAYNDIFLHPFKVTKVHAKHYTDPDGSTRTEVIMQLRFKSSFPKPFSLNSKGCYFSGKYDVGFLRVPLYNEEMKYFYANYADYYYLPAEDVALHKSVASFVDKEHRVRAGARNCYTKKEAAYLPEWDIIFEPIFKRDYDDKVFFFELTDDMKKQPVIFQKYALHILDMMAHHK